MSEYSQAIVNELVIELMYNGSSFQKKSVNAIMQKFVGMERLKELKFFIDTQIKLFKIPDTMLIRAKSRIK
jgi:hypothetical protein